MRWSLFFASLFLCPSLLFGAEATETAASATGGDVSLWNLLAQGGWAMWPLGFCLFAAIALSIHAARETRRMRFIPDAILPELSASMQRRNIAAAQKLVAENPSVLSRVLTPALPRARVERADGNKAAVEASVAESLEHEEALIGQWVNYLNVVATVAPMVGLLGTVSGMIGAFQTIASGGMGRPELLAGDIGEALITTATGLVIGIPAMVAYFVLRNRLGNQVMATAQTATRLIDTLADQPPGAEEL